MRKYFIFLILLLIGMIDAKEIEAWYRVESTISLSQTCKLNGIFEERYHTDAAHLYHYYVESNIIKDLLGNWSILPGYRYVYRKNMDEKWQPEHFALLAFIKKWNIKDIEILNRNRFEYHWPNRTTVYRNRLQITFPFKLTRLRLQPYMYEEIFFSSRVGFNQNRLLMGVKLPVNSLSNWSLAYLFRQVKNDKTWTNADVFYLTFQANF